MGDDDSDDRPADLTYLPFIVPFLIVEFCIVNYYIYWHWRRLLVNNTTTDIPLFSRPTELNWMTVCPWDKLRYYNYII